MNNLKQKRFNTGIAITAATVATVFFFAMMAITVWDIRSPGALGGLAGTLPLEGGSWSFFIVLFLILPLFSFVCGVVCEIACLGGTGKAGRWIYFTTFGLSATVGLLLFSLATGTMPAWSYFFFVLLFGFIHASVSTAGAGVAWFVKSVAADYRKYKDKRDINNQGEPQS